MLRLIFDDRGSIRRVFFEGAVENFVSCYRELILQICNREARMRLDSLSVRRVLEGRRGAL